MPYAVGQILSLNIKPSPIMKNMLNVSRLIPLLFSLFFLSCKDNSIRITLDVDNCYFSEGIYRTKLDDGNILIECLENDNDIFGVFTTTAYANQYDLSGRTIEYKCMMRTEGVTEGYAGLWFRVDGDENGLPFDNMRDRGLTEDTDWTQAVIRVDMPEEFDQIVFGGLLTGNGKAWYKELEIVPVDNMGALQPKKVKKPTKEELAWLRQYVRPLRTCKADDGPDDDLKALADMIGDATVVGLGEVTHGSGEIFMMKHRIVKYLRENCGFDIFSIEASMPDAYKVDDYVSNGQGDPAELVKGMLFWTWNTQEVLDMVWWMYDHNKLSPEKIRFTGFDMQSHETALAEINKNMSGIPGADDKLEKLSLQLDSTNRSLIKRSGVSDNTRNETLALISELSGMLSGSYSPEKVWTQQMLRVLAQFVDNTDHLSRDAYMAENALWIRENNPGSKIALWAHNGHIQKTDKMMGEHLADRLGDEYVNVGFAFHKGSYTAWGDRRLGTYTAQESAPGSFEYYFHLLNEPILVIDLREAMKDDSEHGRWLGRQMNFRGVGAVGGKGHEFRQTSITDKFDILIFIEETLPSVLLNHKK